MTVDLSTVPLVGISAMTRRIISTMLNKTKVLPSDNGLPRDWRGLAHLLELSGEIMLSLRSDSDPTTHILTLLEENKKDITIKHFQTIMKQIDRWDIIDDTQAIFQCDAENYLKQQQRLQESEDLLEKCVDEKHIDEEILTLGDVHRLNQGLQMQCYDACLLYTDEDMSFAAKMVHKLEIEYKLKLCLKNRDLVGGIIFEHEAMVKIITERCNKLIIILTPDFLKSSMNKFFLNYTQALSIEKRQRKIIPCIYKKCELLPELKYISILDYNRKDFYNFWDKLHKSIMSINTNSKIQVKNEEVTETRNLSEHVDISQDNQDKDEINEEILNLQYLQQKNENCTNVTAQMNENVSENAEVLNKFGSKKKTLLGLEKITNWKTKQIKQSSQLITETIPTLPSISNLDTLDLSNTIYKNKKKNLFSLSSKFTEKKIGIKAKK